MFKDERNYHLRLQEFADCFMETDFRKELEAASRGVSGDPSGDPEELALKFLALAILYGVDEDARRISFRKTGGGEVRLQAADRPLPSPGLAMAERIISIARSITHLEEDRGEVPVSLGLRNDRLEVTFQFDRRAGGETFSILLPKLKAA